jgi:hypothetical protein
MPRDIPYTLPAEPITVADVLDELTERLTVRWTKGGGEEDECIMRALYKIVPYDAPLVSRTYVALKAVLPSPWPSIPAFNDAPRTTIDDVLALVERARHELLEAPK